MVTIKNPYKKYFCNIHEITVPDKMREKYMTGIKFVDEALGGFTPGSVGIFTGAPGAGKTTMMLTVANAIGGQDVVVAFNSAEEDVRHLKLTSDRLNLDSPLYCGNLETIEDILAECTKNQAKVLIIDSLQVTGTKKLRAGSVTAMREVTERVIDYCSDNFVVGILIGHVTKNNKIAGHNTLKHMVAFHHHIDLCASARCTTCEPGTRILMSQKNRWAAAGVVKYLGLNSDGFYEIP